MSGDGDWSAFTRGLAQMLSEQGVAVVGVRSRAYLSKPKSPEETARDMERALRYYLARWDRSEILLIGYSRGADFVPFVLNRLSPELRERVKVAAMMSPEVNASFEFHLSDLVKTTPRPTDVPTLPELKRLREQKEYAHLPVICVYGRDEAHSLCPAAPPGMMRVEARAGGHRTSDYASFAELVLEGARGQGPEVRGQGERTGTGTGFVPRSDFRVPTSHPLTSDL
jgi:type IV secretory pathway VirJ component